MFTFQLIRVLVQFGTLTEKVLDIDYLCGKKKDSTSFYQLCFAKLKFIQHLASCVAQAKDDDEASENRKALAMLVQTVFPQACEHGASIAVPRHFI